MDLKRYSLALSSKVALDAGSNLQPAAGQLGREIARRGHTLLSPVDLSLAYVTAAAVHKRTGLSIGFSPAADLRYHLLEFNLPVDVYDWLYFCNQRQISLLNAVIAQSQGLILIGGVLENITELTQALSRFLPIAILVDDINYHNNDLLKYLNHLPVKQQKQIVLHHDPIVLLDAFDNILDEVYKDLRGKLPAGNNELFKELMQSKQDSKAT